MKDGSGRELSYQNCHRQDVRTALIEYLDMGEMFFTEVIQLFGMKVLSGRITYEECVVDNLRKERFLNHHMANYTLQEIRKAVEAEISPILN